MRRTSNVYWSGWGLTEKGKEKNIQEKTNMTVLQIIELILSLAPSGITLTQDILKLIQEIQSVVAAVPAEHQAAVAGIVAKALVSAPSL